MTAKIKEKEF